MYSNQGRVIARGGRSTKLAIPPMCAKRSTAAATATMPPPRPITPPSTAAALDGALSPTVVPHSHPLVSAYSRLDHADPFYLSPRIPTPFTLSFLVYRVYVGAKISLLLPALGELRMLITSFASGPENQVASEDVVSPNMLAHIPMLVDALAYRITMLRREKGVLIQLSTISAAGVAVEDAAMEDIAGAVPSSAAAVALSTSATGATVNGGSDDQMSLEALLALTGLVFSRPDLSRAVTENVWRRLAMELIAAIVDANAKVSSTISTFLQPPKGDSAAGGAGAVAKNPAILEDGSIVAASRRQAGSAGVGPPPTTMSAASAQAAALGAMQQHAHTVAKDRVKVYAALMNRIMKWSDKNMVLSVLFDILDGSIQDLPMPAGVSAPVHTLSMPMPQSAGQTAITAYRTVLLVYRYLWARIQGIVLALADESNAAGMRAVPLFQTLDRVLRSPSSDLYRSRILELSVRAEHESVHAVGIILVRETCRQIVKGLGTARALIECGRAIVGATRSELWLLLEALVADARRKVAEKEEYDCSVSTIKMGVPIPEAPEKQSDAKHVSRLRIKIVDPASLNPEDRITAASKRIGLPQALKSDETAISWDEVQNQMTAVLARLFTHHLPASRSASSISTNTNAATRITKSQELKIENTPPPYDASQYHCQEAITDLYNLLQRHEATFPDIHSRLQERLAWVGQNIRDEVLLSLRRIAQRRAATDGLRYVGEFLLERLRRTRETIGLPPLELEKNTVRNVEFERMESTGDIRVLVDDNVVLTVTHEELREVEAQTKASNGVAGVLSSPLEQDMRSSIVTVVRAGQGFQDKLEEVKASFGLHAPRKTDADEAVNIARDGRTPPQSRGTKREENPVNSDEDYDADAANVRHFTGQDYDDDDGEFDEEGEYVEYVAS